MRFTNLALLGCTKPCMRKWRLRLFDFLVSRWLLNALYLRILPVPVTLKVFLARECVFIFGMICQIWDCKGNETFVLNINNCRFFLFISKNIQKYNK